MASVLVLLYHTNRRLILHSDAKYTSHYKPSGREADWSVCYGRMYQLFAQFKLISRLPRRKGSKDFSCTITHITTGPATPPRQLP